MIASLRSADIDVAIGLTEGWVAGLAQPSSSQKPEEQKKGGGGYKIVGTYVETPLCWAISTGAKREDIPDVSELEGKKMGVSRVGSGSYVMGFVLADARGWLNSSGKKEPPFSVVPLQTFANLRSAVNDNTADFFMWEHFTSKRYYTNGSLKKIGEIYTPWSSWKIVARDEVLEKRKEELEEVFEKVDQGVRYFEENGEEAVGYISGELDYSEEDAREWLGKVRFAHGVRGVIGEVIGRTIETLRKAGVVEGGVRQDMIGIERGG